MAYLSREVSLWVGKKDYQMSNKIDFVEEIFLIVMAIEACSKIAPEGLAYILNDLRQKLYSVAVGLDESGS